MKHTTIKVDFLNKRIIDRIVVDLDKDQIEAPPKGCCAEALPGKRDTWCGFCYANSFEDCYYRS